MGVWRLLLSLYILLLTSTCSIAVPRNLSPSLVRDGGRSRLDALGPPTYYTRYDHQFLDHFNFVDQRGFPQKALVTEEYWMGSGPMLLYTGNEGPVETYYDNSGFIFELAKEFNALVVFIEHRFYGSTLPFGPTESFKPANIAFLTVEQALADYAVYVQDLKKDYNITKVIAFGGSYGGMLSAWMRFKYPNLIDGALAASAPIFYPADLVPSSAFYSIVTQDFEEVDPKCPTIVREAFTQLLSLANQGDEGLEHLTKSFKLCELLTLDKVDHLIGWVKNSFASLAMVDYPYPASYLAPLPAYPINVSCQTLLNTQDMLTGLADAAGLFYNGTGGNLRCYDIAKEFIECSDPTGCGLGSDSKSWDFQACTEMMLNCSTNNKTDMFPPSVYNVSGYCFGKWGVAHRPWWMAAEYWGKDILSASNIIFSNGKLDPWSTGGVLSSPSDSLIAIVIEGAAHHLDLRGSDPRDPPSVTNARKQEMDIIRKWIGA